MGRPIKVKAGTEELKATKLSDFSAQIESTTPRTRGIDYKDEVRIKAVNNKWIVERTIAKHSTKAIIVTGDDSLSPQQRRQIQNILSQFATLWEHSQKHGWTLYVSVPLGTTYEPIAAAFERWLAMPGIEHVDEMWSVISGDSIGEGLTLSEIRSFGLAQRTITDEPYTT